MLLLAHGASRKRPSRALQAMPWLHALLIGLAQMIAVARGVSRSGSTITAALLLGYAPLDAAFFSFLLAIPAIGGAALLELLPLLHSGGTVSLAVGLGPLAGAFILTFLVGVGALRLLLVSARSALWWPYAAYSLALAALCFGVA